jgi:SAM-dependent methyltransferase
VTPDAANASGAERENLYARRDDVPALADCYFYHTTDVPGHGTIEGEWDLRGGVDAYLGDEPVQGRRVLEVGTASGFLCFEMERRGAEVVAYDLSSATPWDIVPYAGLDLEAVRAQRAEHIARINASWWFCHNAYRSAARVVYGAAAQIPAAIGRVDLCTFGSVLLHLRDPLSALQGAAALRPDTIVVTDLVRRRRVGFLPERPSQRRSALFVPNGEIAEPIDTWWSFSPSSIANLLAIVGYRTERVVRHAQRYRGSLMPMFTVVAKRNLDVTLSSSKGEGRRRETNDRLRNAVLPSL